MYTRTRLRGRGAGVYVRYHTYTILMHFLGID